MNDIKKELQRLQKDEQERGRQRKAENIGSVAGRTTREMLLLQKFIVQFLHGVLWTWDNIMNPVWKFVTWPFMKFGWKHYRQLWDRVVYFKDSFGVTHFSKTRAGMMVASSLFAIYIGLGTIQLSFDTAVYFSTVQHNHLLFLSNSQEIYPDQDIHSVQGCEIAADVKGPVFCDENESLYFRVYPSWFNFLWSIFTGNGWFQPDYVAGAVGSDWSRCYGTTYGLPYKINIFGFRFNPTLLSARCELGKVN